MSYPRPNPNDDDRHEFGFYVENRWVVHQLLDSVDIEGVVHDPCCGTGTIPSVCLERGIPATGSDIRDRGFGEVRDTFDLGADGEMFDNIISNFPYGNRIKDGRRLIDRVEHCRRLVPLIRAIVSARSFSPRTQAAKRPTAGFAGSRTIGAPHT